MPLLGLFILVKSATFNALCVIFNLREGLFPALVSRVLHTSWWGERVEMEMVTMIGTMQGDISPAYDRCVHTAVSSSAHFMVSTFIASYLLSRCICYFLEHILGNDQSIVGGHPVHWMWLSQFLCFQYQLCLTPSHNPHHKNCHRDSVVMSIVQLSNFFNDQWKINHQIWLHDNSLCCVRLDSMLCYNPLLAACEAQLRVPVNILTSVQFNPAAVAAAAQHFILPMLGQHVLVPSCYGGRQPPVIIVTRS